MAPSRPADDGVRSSKTHDWSTRTDGKADYELRRGAGDLSPLFDQPAWVTPTRPRRLQDWGPSTTVFVTSWGDSVHLYRNCQGTKAYGSDGEVIEARLQDQVCAARRGCGRCFGEFFSESTLASLEQLLIDLHGEVDRDQPARKVIAAKARLRFGTKEQRHDRGAG